MDENNRKTMQRKKKFNQQKTGAKFIPERQRKRLHIKTVTSYFFQKCNYCDQLRGGQGNGEIKL